MDTKSVRIKAGMMMKGFSWGLGLALMASPLLGCTGDNSDSDTDTDTLPPLGPLDISPVAGTVSIDTWGSNSGWISADLREQTAPQIWDEHASAQDCLAVTRKEEGSCAQACYGLCTPEGECLDAGESISAGDISITGLLTETTLQFQDGAYRPTPEPDASSPMYELNATLQVESDGDSFDGFALSALGVAPLETSLHGANLKSASDLTITWEAESSGQIYVEILLGHHLHPPIAAVLCLTEDDGSHTLPGSLFENLPETGFFEPHSSTMYRQYTSKTDTSRGPVAFSVRSRAGIGGFFVAEE
jgi:hypothetical protein